VTDGALPCYRGRRADETGVEAPKISVLPPRGSLAPRSYSEKRSEAATDIQHLEGMVKRVVPRTAEFLALRLYLY
jgi:hypothetical protein